MKSFDELKSFAIADILSVSGKDKISRVIENHMNTLIEVAFIKGHQSKQAEVDELRKRLDDTLDNLNNAYPESWAYCVEKSIKILKGESNEF